MGLTVKVWVGDLDSQTVGSYESVQLSEKNSAVVMRDPNGETIVERLHGAWYIGSPDIGTPGWQKRQRAWSDVTIEPEEHA